MKEMGIRAMNDPPKGRSTENEQQQAAEYPDSINEPQIPGRRELIERYAKAAVIAAPLLFFASNAHAIHSKP